MILTAEADSLLTDATKLLNDCGLVGCHPSIWLARMNSSKYIRLLWESDDDKNGHAAIFEVKFGKTSERAVKESRERSAEQLSSDLEPVASAVEGSDLGPTDDSFEPTASCINDTKERQLVTRSGLPRLRCCVYHLHHKRAMTSPAVLDFFKTMLQQVCHFNVDVIARDANAAAYKNYKNKSTKICTILQLQSCKERCNVKSMRDTHLKCKLHIDYSTNNHPPQLHTATDLDCCSMATLFMVKASRTPNHEKTLEQSQTESFYDFS